MHIFGNPTIKHAELPGLYTSLKLWIDARPPFTIPATSNNSLFVNIINRANKNVPAWSTVGNGICVFNSFRNNLPAISLQGTGGNFSFINPTLTFGTNSTVVACCIPSNAAGDNSVIQTSSGNGAWFGINSSLQAYIGDNSGVVYTSSGTVSNGSPCTIAATVSGSASSLYINGTLDTNGAHPNWVTNNCNIIGGNLSGTNNIKLAEYIYINDLLSAQDIYLLHQYLQYKWF